MRRYSLYLFDLDGTLYRGNQALPGAAQTVARLKQSGCLVRFLTNNSALTPVTQSVKLQGMGIDAQPSEILTSGLGAADYLAEQKLKKAFVVGEPGLVEMLKSRGVVVSTSAERVDAVVVGICRSLTYELLDQAMQLIRQGARFIATNTDSTYPMEKGRLVPGAGSIVAAVQACSATPPFVIGKPNPLLVEMSLRLAGCPANDALVIGDRFETDIESGKRAGCDTLLVLTGVTPEAPPGQLSAESLLELLA